MVSGEDVPFFVNQTSIPATQTSIPAWLEASQPRVPTFVDISTLENVSRLWKPGSPGKWRTYDLPSGDVKIAIENDEIVDFPIQHGDLNHSKLLVITRGYSSFKKISKIKHRFSNLKHLILKNKHVITWHEIDISEEISKKVIKRND